MRPEHWRRIEELFIQITAAPPEQHAEMIASACGADVELRREIESLLHSHLGQSGPLDAPPSWSNPVEPDTSTSSEHDPSPQLPAPASRVGPYRLLAPIGEGGMGTVWTAERADGLMKRKVALKLPHWSWVGPDLAARMARERDILAGLEHPNIARLYDAGVDALGRPYLAMEYVEGEPIDVHCRNRDLPVRDCLLLVLQVARAVTHAHSRLVVHRDLKPSNILVTADGSVRLLDFGIAKLLEADQARATRLTQFAGRALTPEYASPEQIKGDAIGTASDVYSLAVIMYELLTGAKPYKLKRGTAAELEEAITTAEPRLASEASVDPARQRQLHGDLDAILNQALKKNVAERYPTVDAFARDIERHLNGKVVHARPDSAWYRLGKFAARNRIALAAAATAAIALVAATAVSVSQARVAAEQRNRALMLLSRNEAVMEFVSLMLTEVGSPDQPITLDSLLERSESMIYSGVTDNPDHQAEILGLLGSYYASFGNMRKAETLLAKGIELSSNSSDRGLRAHIRCRHASARAQLGSNDEAKSTIERVIAEPGVPAEVIALCLQHRAFIAQATNDAQAALEFALRARAQLQRAERFDVLLDADLLGDVGYAYQLLGRTRDADRYFAESIRAFEKNGRPEHPSSISVRNNWGLARYAAGDIKGALGMYESAIEVAKKHAAGGAVPPYLISNRAQALLDLDRVAEAVAEYDRVIAAGEAGDNPTFIVVGYVGKAKACLDQRDFDCAEGWLNRAVAVTGDALPPDSPKAIGLQLFRSGIALGRGRLAEAYDGYSRIVAFWDSRNMAINGAASALMGRADTLLEQREFAKAIADAQRALTIARATQGDEPYSRITGLALLTLSRIHSRMGLIDDSRREAREAMGQLDRTIGTDHPRTREARELASR